MARFRIPDWEDLARTSTPDDFEPQPSPRVLNLMVWRWRHPTSARDLQRLCRWKRRRRAGLPVGPAPRPEA